MELSPGGLAVVAGLSTITYCFFKSLFRGLGGGIHSCAHCVVSGSGDKTHVLFLPDVGVWLPSPHNSNLSER